MGRVAIVTGAGGFLGGHLLRRLEDDGWTVRALDVGAGWERPAGPNERVHRMAVDVADYDAIRRTCDGAGAIFHLAALLPQRRAPEERMRAVNVGGARNIYRAARDAGIPTVVHLSSAEVYGIPERTPCSEDAALRPIGEYGRNKVEAEGIAAEAARGGIHVPILRPPTIVGAGMPEKLLNKFIDDASRGRPLTLIGDGSTRFQMVAVSDVVAACLRALEVPEASGNPLNIGSDNVPTMREMALRVKERVGSRSRLVAVPRSIVIAVVKTLGLVGLAPLEPEHLAIALRDYVFDIAKAVRVLGWKPEKDNVDGLVEAYAARVGR